MDLSHELWTLVETTRQQKSSGAPFSQNSTLQTLSIPLEEQRTNASLLSTSQTLDEAAVNAISRASAHVRSLVVALDAATPSSTAHLQNSLLLSDAELLSVSSSLKAFTETLTKINALAAAAKRNDRRGKKTEGKQSSQKSLMEEAEMGDAGTGTGLVAHLQQAVRIQEQRVASKRLQVALAKEELALYKSELFLFGHCGVLSCSDAVVAELTHYQPPSSSASPPSPRNDERWRRPLDEEHVRRRGVPSSSFSASLSRPSRSGFGTTFRVVDGMMQKAAQTVKAAGNHADSALHVALTGSHMAARQLLSAGTSSVDGIVMMDADVDRRRISSNAAAESSTALSTKTGVGAIQLPPFTHDDLTKEEEARLQEQSQALLQLQNEATAQDARAIEMSIHELSQLTSLMNEQVMQQTEQFSILVRNTEAAHTNVQKAVGEVKKPLRAFWNPTRQLIALLWACMAVLLAANRLLR
ncbi:hypothetical protein ABB37_03869 [Leptomonas pyrrhocoris]|uniref:t-SNARE coiled-coil homology domain-containing protein n=1 Tax=Leptomonas pyrrhocoris TaxID=157538 RepID=A0A0N0VFN9_LEPPY|nr:hypothetical protein ABB37_03869 [Leptomonas pyrrhocoris]XP_015659960.1 hypothetical protein ABB37_03869 [Leptomonas pyrrhocoris]KPA81520.1 hypothetical protein ABB37_03869 [Leptomonas pyrrhocoris]KPA81521.1 hypothetical protein ABB37_03869 [Leptomonas pyrrhocoris]|eukprot:XP_015659959.1 hypothetical protein ABB37_03869 [Leptomonas pyrrhocoris]